MSDDRIRSRGPNFLRGQALHQGSAQTSDRVQADLQRRFVSHPGAVVVGDFHAALFRKFRDLHRRPVHQYHLYVQGTQHSQIEEEVRKRLRCQNLAVQRDHKGAPAELRHILQDTSEIAELHGSANTR